MGTRWINFYAAFLVVLGVSMVLGAASTHRALETGGLLGLGLIPNALVAYGLYRRRDWAFTLNFVVIAFDLVGFALLDRDDTLSIALRFSIAFFAWGIPNYLYFKNRRHLFH